MRNFKNLQWSLVPGPPNLLGANYPSDQVQYELVRYTPELVAGVMEGLDEVTVERTGDGDWWEWRAIYEGDLDIFELNMTLFDTEPPFWGGCGLSGVKEASEALNLWRKVAAVLPGAYLHSSEAMLYTVEGFIHAFMTTNMTPVPED